MANFTCLAAARHEVLRRAGWNVETQGLQRAPRVRVHRRRRSAHLRGRRAALSRLRHRRNRAHSGRRPGPHARGRARRRAREGRLARRSSARRPATSAPAPAIRSTRSSRARTRAAPGCTSTARSASGRPPVPELRIAGDGHRERGLVGDRRAQMAQRAVRLGPRDRRRRRAASRGDEHEGVVPAARRRRRAHRHGLGAGIVTPIARAAALRVVPNARRRRHRRHRAPQLRAGAAHGRSAVAANPASRSSTTSC